MSETDNAAQAAIEGHPFCWIEFQSKDAVATTKFFADVFGWQSQPFAQMEGYFIFSTPKGLMGGIHGDPQLESPKTVPYLYVADIDQTLQQINSAGGGTVLGKTEIPDTDGGHIALFKDAAGCTLGLADMPMGNEYSPMPFGEGEKPLNNTICSLELFGGDFDKTKAFYEELFTWGMKQMGGNYMAFSPGSGVSGVFQNHTPQTPAVVYVWADDINAAVEKVKSSGGVMFGDVLDGGEMGRFAYFTAPGGVMLGMIGK